MAVTLADIITAGRGRYELRLVIEGVREQFVTAGMDVGALADGRDRVPGLRRDSVGFSESCYFAGAEMDVRISPVQIDEGAFGYRGRATALFSTIAQVVDQLTTTLGGDAGTDTTAAVRDSALFATSTWYYSATETFKVTAKPTGTSLTIVRGEWQSTAQAHYVDPGTRASVSPIYDHPPGFVSRRVWLYVHGEGETALTDAGTVVWRGVIGKEPSEKDAVWTLQVEPRTKLLDASIAAAFDRGIRLRGLYYAGESCFALTVQRRADATQGGAPDGEAQIRLAGFFENRSAFCAALQSALNGNATISGWGVSFEARMLSDGQWDLYVRTPSPARYVETSGGSVCDPYFYGGITAESSLLASGIEGGLEADALSSVVTVSADTMYRCGRNLWAPSLATPTGGGTSMSGDQLGIPPISTHFPWVRASDADIVSWPLRRIYVDSVGALTVGDVVILKREEGYSESLEVTAIGSGYLELRGVESPDVFPKALAAGTYQPEILPTAVFAAGDGTLATFRDDLISRAPTLANRAQGPWLTSDDVASWTTAVAEASGGRSWLQHRVYAFSKGVKVREVLREEMKLYGLIPYLDADAKIAVRPMTFDTSTPTAVEIDEDVIVIDDGFGSVAGDDDGLVTVLEVFLGYDPSEDKWSQAPAYQVRNLGAIARVKREAVLEIKPRSRPLGPDMTPDDAEVRGRLVTEVFGARRTQTVRIPVTLRCLNTRIGDPVLVTVRQLPGDGDRGMWTAGAGLVQRTGYVTGRTWDLAAGTGELTVLLHELAVAAYTPSGWVTAASGGGTTWTLTLDATRYSGTSDVSFFNVNDSIVLREWDATSPTTREGIIASINVGANQVTVTLASAWAGLGGASYTLSWDTSDDADTTAVQLSRGAYLAGTTGRIAVASGTPGPARRFAP